MHLQGKRLKKNREFVRVYQKGKSLAGRYSVLYFLKNKDINNKIGISVSKKVGNSVIRHRIKRFYKESFRLNDQDIKRGYDLVIIARKRAVELNFNGCQKDFLYLVKRAGLYYKKREGY